MVLDLQLDTSMIQMEYVKVTKNTEMNYQGKAEKYDVLSINFDYTKLYKKKCRIRRVMASQWLWE